MQLMSMQKKIRNGASKVALSNEEKLTLEKCINK